jgi:hypothetical protein
MADTKFTVASAGIASIKHEGADHPAPPHRRFSATRQQFVASTFQQIRIELSAHRAPPHRGFARRSVTRIEVMPAGGMLLGELRHLGPGE